MTQYGYITDSRTDDGRTIIIGPFHTRAEAEQESGGLPLVEIPDAAAARQDCPACGTRHARMPMPADTQAVYDAVFPAVLDWSEDDDCGMPALMRDVAEAAAAALRPTGT